MESNNELVSGRTTKSIKQKSIAIIFTVTVMLASLAIFTGIAFNSALMTIIFPVTIMIGYIFYVQNADINLASSIKGDSYYYLGFILTLVSLAASLINLSSNNSVDMDSVIGSFGAALFTTIIGLVARLTITTFSAATAERTEQLENEIENSLLSFRLQLEELTNGVITSIVKVQTTTQETLQKTLRSYASINDELTNQFSSTMNEGEQKVSEAMNKLANSIDQVVVSPDLISKPIHESLSGVISALNEHEKDYVALNKGFNTKHKSLSKQLESTSNIINEHIDRQETALSNSIQKQMVEYEKTLNEVGTSIISSLGDITDLKLRTEDNIKENLLELESDIKLVSNSIKSLDKPITSAIKNISEGAGSLGKNQKALYETYKKLNAVNDAAKDNIKSISENKIQISELNIIIAEFSKQLQESTAQSKLSSSKAIEASTATEESSLQLAKDISGVYSELTQQLRSIRDASQ